MSAEGSTAVALPRADKNGTIIGLAVDSRGLLITSVGPQGVVLSMHDQNGKAVNNGGKKDDSFTYTIDGDKLILTAQVDDGNGGAKPVADSATLTLVRVKE